MVEAVALCACGHAGLTGPSQPAPHRDQGEADASSQRSAATNVMAVRGVLEGEDGALYLLYPAHPYTLQGAFQTLNPKTGGFYALRS